jgi:hypothetical protein
MRYGETVKKRFVRIGGFCVIGIMALQFANPAHQNPPAQPGHDVLAASPPPPSVAATLRNACYDCHSSETKWPWYSYVAPVSWSVARDVNAARASLNFSDWPREDAKRARKRWRRIAEEVESREMPPSNYTWMHRPARLDAGQRAELVRWAREQSEQ